MQSPDFALRVRDAFNTIAGVWLVAFGLNRVLGGAARMQADSLEPARRAATYLHCDPAVLWGTSAVVIGAAILLPLTRAVGLYAAVFYFGFYGLGMFLARWWGAPGTDASGWCTYLLFVCPVLSLFAVVESRRRYLATHL